MKLTSFVCIGNTNGKHRNLSLPEGDVLIHTGGYTTCYVPNGIVSKRLANSLQPEPPDDIIDWMKDQPFKEKLMVPAFRDIIHNTDIESYISKFERAGIRVGMLECLTIAGLGVGCYNYWYKRFISRLTGIPPSPLEVNARRYNFLTEIGAPYGLDILITNALSVPDTLSSVMNNISKDDPSHREVFFNLVPTICLFSGSATGKTLPVKVLDTTCYNTNVWHNNKQVPEIVHFYIADGGK